MPTRPLSPEAYRYPHERLILAFTVLLVGGVILITATATLCGSLLFMLAMLAFAYFANQVHHEDLLKKAHAVTPASLPHVAAQVAACQAWLGAEPVRVYIAPQRALNAYTFGLSHPKVIVVYAPLLNLLDADELCFVIGHELGHVRLGHTWLNSLVGGMAGIPSPFGAAVVLYVAFRWWNRACEFSADRAGLLACGQPAKAISALIKLASGARTAPALAAALKRLEAEDADVAQVFGELLGTHPLLIRRVEALRRYAQSAEFARLQRAP